MYIFVRLSVNAAVLFVVAYSNLIRDMCLEKVVLCVLCVCGVLGATLFQLLLSLLPVVKRSIRRDSPIFVLLRVLCFQRQPFRFVFYVTAADVKNRVMAVKYLPVLHHCTD